MRILLRIVLQFGVVLAACAAFVAYVGDDDAWLILIYPMTLALPGLIVSALVLAPLEGWLDRRGQGGLIWLAGPAAGALVAPAFLQVIGTSWERILTALPILMAVGAIWGLLWALTRPVGLRSSGQ